MRAVGAFRGGGMQIRVILCLVLVALAQDAVAQDAVADSAPMDSPVVPVGWEWGVGASAGRRSGWWAPSAQGSAGFGWVVAADLLVHLGERAVVGTMVSSGVALEALAGVRFRLSPALRLDVLAEGGLTRQELGYETYWAPTVGARAGLAWARRGGGRYVTAGVAALHLVPARMEPACGGVASSCGSVAVGGGTLVGAFVTFGSSYPHTGR